MRKLKSPVSVVWEIINTCNYKCPHCRAYADYALPSPVTEEKIIRELIGNEILSVNLSGGEPLLHPGICRLIETFAGHQMDVGISTNGWYFGERAEELVKSGLTFLQVSVDGPAEVHDRFRGVAGAHERAIRALATGKEYGVRTQMNVTMTSENLPYLFSNIELAERLGIDRIFFRRCVPAGRGKENRYLLIGKEQYLDALRQLRAVKVKGLDIAIDDPILTVLGEDVDVHSNIIGCTAGMKSLGIDSSGSVFPCIFMREKIGDLNTESLQDIWENSGILKDLRVRKIGACGACRYNYICGGCRAYAGLYEKDAMCPLSNRGG